MAKILFFETAVNELIVENGKASGGAAVQTLVWMEGLHQKGHEVYLAREANDTRAVLPAYAFIQFLRIFDQHKGIKKIRWISYRFPAIFKAINTIKPDYLYESVPFWGSWIVDLICKVQGVKHIIRISNDRHLDERYRMVATKFNQESLLYSLKKADLVLTQNNFQYETLTNKYPKQRILKIYNPIKINPEYCQPKTLANGPIVWIANFRYQKNLKLLFEIASICSHETFKIAGVPTVKYDDESKFYVQELEKLPQVEFLGLVGREQVWRLLREAKFLLNTSRFEGFSNTFLEAMATGTPILSSTLVDPDDIIKSHTLGYVYKDAQDLSDFLANLNSEKYIQLSTNCCAYVFANHEYLAMTDKILTFLSIDR